MFARSAFVMPLCRSMTAPTWFPSTPVARVRSAASPRDSCLPFNTPLTLLTLCGYFFIPCVVPSVLFFCHVSPHWPCAPWPCATLVPLLAAPATFLFVTSSPGPQWFTPVDPFDCFQLYLCWGHIFCLVFPPYFYFSMSAVVLSRFAFTSSLTCSSCPYSGCFSVPASNRFTFLPACSCAFDLEANLALLRALCSFDVVLCPGWLSGSDALACVALPSPLSLTPCSSPLNLPFFLTALLMAPSTWRFAQAAGVMFGAFA